MASFQHHSDGFQRRSLPWIPVLSWDRYDNRATYDKIETSHVPQRTQGFQILLDCAAMCSWFLTMRPSVACSPCHDTISPDLVTLPSAAPDTLSSFVARMDGIRYGGVFPPEFVLSQGCKEKIAPPCYGDAAMNGTLAYQPLRGETVNSTVNVSPLRIVSGLTVTIFARLHDTTKAQPIFKAVGANNLVVASFSFQKEVSLLVPCHVSIRTEGGSNNGVLFLPSSLLKSWAVISISCALLATNPATLVNCLPLLNKCSCDVMHKVKICVVA
jgi:hypothetical protein